MGAWTVRILQFLESGTAADVVSLPEMCAWLKGKKNNPSDLRNCQPLGSVDSRQLPVSLSFFQHGGWFTTDSSDCAASETGTSAFVSLSVLFLRPL